MGVSNRQPKDPEAGSNSSLCFALGSDAPSACSDTNLLTTDSASGRPQEKTGGDQTSLVVSLEEKLTLDILSNHGAAADTGINFFASSIHLRHPSH